MSMSKGWSPEIIAVMERHGPKYVCMKCTMPVADPDSLCHMCIAHEDMVKRAAAKSAVSVVPLKAGRDWGEQLRKLADQADRGELGGVVIATLVNVDPRSYSYLFMTDTYELQLVLASMLHRRAQDRMMTSGHGG